MENLLKKIAKRLEETNPDKYLKGYEDYGHYNNGVGFASYGYESVYDEDLSYEDAKEELLSELDIITGKKEGMWDEEILEVLKQEEVYNFIRNKIESA